MSHQDHQNQFESGFYRGKDGGLILLDKTGQMIKLDFDVDKLNLQKKEDQTIKNNIENESDMNLENSETTDMTKEQLEENYWVETSKTKFDGSTAMMEKRISGCMEVTGKSREECSKEVKKRMIKDGSDNTNTTDVADKPTENDEETEEETEEEDKEKTDAICPEELKILRDKAERLDAIEKELEAEKTSKEDMKSKLDEVLDMFATIKAERDAELEVKRLEKIKQISTDFDIPEDKIKEDSMDKLERYTEILDMAIKKTVEEEPIELDMEDMESDFMKRATALTNKYKIKVVK